MSLVVGGILAGLGLASWSDELLDKAAELLFDGAGKRVLDETQARLRAYTGGIPPNHDLEHAIRFAELTSTLVLLEEYRRQDEGARFDTRGALPPPFIGAARKWLHEQIGLCPSLRVAANDELVAELDRVLDQSIASTRRNEVRGILAEAEQQVWLHLTTGAARNNGGEPPAEFKDLFFGDDARGPGWSVTFVAFMREALKKNANAEVAFVTTRLATARTTLDRIENKVDALKGDTKALLTGQGEIRRDLEQIPDAVVNRLLAALDARGETRRAEDAGLERETIIKIARRLRPDEMLDFDQAVVELENAVDVALDVIARGERGTNYDAFVDLVLAKVAEKTRLGDFDGGAQAVDEALIDLNRREAEQRDIFRRSRVALLEAGVDQDILRRDASAVARRIEGIMAAEHPDGRPASSPAFRERYNRFYEEGRTKGVNFSLSVAIELARRMVASARSADERGVAGSLLGNALWRLGEREGGTARLEEAVTAYHAALAEYTRDRAPLQWAMTQNNLGNALWRLGERESGTARLEEAGVAYRAAMAEYTRDRVPLQWAGAQNNLGLVLWRLGERESGTARLEEAVTAYGAALEEWTRDRVPLQWAGTQNNLGIALEALGERESGTARLEEAVAAYGAALAEYTRDRVPLDWAMTQNNLGNALKALAERESGTARLEEAVAAYNAALEERTRDRVPLDWAMTQNNLGNALTALGERESGTARLEQAVAAYGAALAEYTRDRAPLQWAGTQNNLGAALRTLGERESGTARLEEAVAAYRAALAERTRDRVPLDWAMSTGNQGVALMMLAERIGNSSRARVAVEQIEIALATMREGGHAPFAAYYECPSPPVGGRGPG